MTGFLRRCIAHPLTRGMDIDDPDTTALRLQIIQSKPFLRKLYEEWYQRIATCYSTGAKVLELGSGAGFLKSLMPNLITSELFPTPGVELVIDAQSIALSDASLDGIVMTDVLHHLPDCNSFFLEATRVIRVGGQIVMIEPWNSSWSRWVYTHLHHEPFEPNAPDWRIPSSGPLSGANGALPWIIFKRDLTYFEEQNPKLRLVSITQFMPFAYLLSGGVSFRSFFPGWLYPFIRYLEQHSNEPERAMFAMIIVARVR